MMELPGRRRKGRRFMDVVKGMRQRRMLGSAVKRGVVSITVFHQQGHRWTLIAAWSLRYDLQICPSHWPAAA